MSEQPYTWGDVNLRQFYEINRILGSDLDELLKYCSILACMQNRPVEAIHAMNIEDWKREVARLAFLQSPIPRPKLGESIKIKGKLFSINREVSKLTASQYIDFLHYAEHPLEHVAHNVLALFIQPAEIVGGIFGRKLKIVEHDPIEVANYLKENLPITVANHLLVFFSKVWKRLIGHTRTYLGLQMRTIVIMMWLKRMLNRKIDGDGLEALQALQKRRIELGMKYMS